MEGSLRRRLVVAASIVPLFLTIFTLQRIPSVLSASAIALAGSGFATVGETLYVQGGYWRITNESYVSTFMSLSLKTPWNDTSPPWQVIPVGNNLVPSFYHGIAASTDKTRLVFWGSFGAPHSASLAVYNIPNNTWSSLPILPNPKPFDDRITFVIDPTTPGGGLGDMYIPSGCMDSTNTPNMCLLASNKNTPVLLQMPGGLVPRGLVGSSFVYCTLRKTMFLYGGSGLSEAEGYPVNPNLYEYTTSTSTWSLLQPQGATPGALERHCMVETTDGSKMIVFGGLITGNNVTSRLFILHINNLTWTEGPDVGSANRRASHVCATNGDSFVVWGGFTVQNGITVVANTTPLIYNIPNNTWVQNFVVSNNPPPTTTTLASTSPSTSASSMSTPTSSDISAALPPSPKKSSNVGAAAGGAAGGIIALAAIGYFIFRWRKRASYSGQHLSQLRRSGHDRDEGLEKKEGGFFGRKNNVEYTDGKDRNRVYPNTGAIGVKSQDTSAQHPGNSYHKRQPQSLPLLPVQPATKGRDRNISNMGGARVLTSEIDSMDHSRFTSSELESLQFSGVSLAPPPLLPFQPWQSFMPLTSPISNPQILGSSLVYPYGQSIYYDADRSASSAGSPHGSIGSFPVESPGRSPHYGGGSNVHSGSFKSANSSSIGTPVSNLPQYSPNGLGIPVGFGLRSPQQYGPGYETSPAAWMAAMNMGESFGSPQAVVPQWSDSSGEIGKSGLYFPPPPGQQSPAQSESELMRKRLMLMKVQHELELEKMRLKQESQRKLIKKQL